MRRVLTVSQMDMQFFSEIGKAFEELDKDVNVRSIILWAEGKLFTAGLDLKSSAEMFGSHLKIYNHLPFQLMETPMKVPLSKTLLS